MQPNTIEYIVLAHRKETSTTKTLFLARIDGIPTQFRAGQYITVYFPDLSQTLGKSYSISSAPSEGVFTITVKAIGRFSNRLCSLNKNDRLLATGPHGDFYPETDRPLVLIAGGIGITPLRSILIETVTAGSGICPIYLLYSSRLSSDMPFGKEMSKLSKKVRLLIVLRFITREPMLERDIHYRRIQPEDIFCNANSKHAEFLISGSLSFVLEQRKILLKQGINRERIHAHCFG